MINVIARNLSESVRSCSVSAVNGDCVVIELPKDYLDGNSVATIHSRAKKFDRELVVIRDCFLDDHPRSDELRDMIKLEIEPFIIGVGNVHVDIDGRFIVVSQRKTWR